MVTESRRIGEYVMLTRLSHHPFIAPYPSLSTSLYSAESICSYLSIMRGLVSVCDHLVGRNRELRYTQSLHHSLQV